MWTCNGYNVRVLMTEINVFLQSHLKCLPDFSPRDAVLKRVCVSSCTELSAFPDSLRFLTAVTDMQITMCHSLTGLPESLGCMMLLTSLRVGMCSSFTSMPESLGNLASLTMLDLGGCRRLRRLPETLGQLRELRTILLNNCDALTALPESLGQVITLHTLMLKSCRALTALPESLTRLPTLTILDVSECLSLNTLPHFFGTLSSLRVLNASGSSLIRIPCGLPALFTLNLSACHALTCLPDAAFARLEVLDVRSCRSLVRLPTWVGSMSPNNVFASNCRAMNFPPQNITCSGSRATLLFLQQHNHRCKCLLLILAARNTLPSELWKWIVDDNEAADASAAVVFDDTCYYN